ncbi:hypothetical protein IWX47DRAFT_869027 [Phyllosticta citricarpa]
MSFSWTRDSIRRRLGRIHDGRAQNPHLHPTSTPTFISPCFQLSRLHASRMHCISSPVPPRASNRQRQEFCALHGSAAVRPCRLAPAYTTWSPIFHYTPTAAVLLRLDSDNAGSSSSRSRVRPVSSSTLLSLSYPVSLTVPSPVALPSAGSHLLARSFAYPSRPLARRFNRLPECLRPPSPRLAAQRARSRPQNPSIHPSVRRPRTGPSPSSSSSFPSPFPTSP